MGLLEGLLILLLSLFGLLRKIYIILLLQILLHYVYIYFNLFYFLVLEKKKEEIDEESRDTSKESKNESLIANGIEEEINQREEKIKKENEIIEDFM